ncbi:MAG: hypothetical protein MUQ48_11665 [Pirellulales bacterium]|nr:hypothetical protein [Planctomycetia bacterium]MDO7679204.1 hypothetical protein [Pirellulales bacterium]
MNWPNAGDQQIAIKGLSMPLGLIASLLHRVVLACSDWPQGFSHASVDVASAA